jgi:peptidoglycan/LPS O-acetylase OafA/YrhL
MGTITNRFDFIRLTLACLVFLYHVVVLSAVAPNSLVEGQLATLAELAIQAFFIVSGALVYGSLERSRSLSDYGEKRLRRLYPAYLVVIFVPAVLSLSVLIVEPAALQEIIRYVAANLAFLNFLQPDLPYLFEGQRFTAVNGALWTLKIEVMFYLVLPALAWGLARMRQYWWIGIAVLILGAFAWREAALAMDVPYRDQLARQLPGQMMYFGAGMALWRLWDRARRQARTLFGIGVVTLLAALLFPSLDALRVLGLTALIAGIAFMPGPQMNAGRWGDISYGVYITHFPIVQALVAMGVFTTFGFAAGLLISTILVIALSYLLWWWVEKPSLRQDSYYRKASEELAYR